MLEEDITNSRRPVFLRALRAAFARVPLLLVCWGAPLLVGLVLVAPWMGWFSATTANQYAPGSVLASMDVTFRHDHRESLEALRESGGAAAAMLGFLMLIIGVFSGGGWLQVYLERTSGHSVRRFLWGGAKYFWRFARLCVLTLLLLAFARWVLFGWPWETVIELLFGATQGGELEQVASEWTAVWITWFQAGAFALAFALVMVWGDYTRTRMALHNGRSALWAGLCSWFLLIAHPVRTLRPMALLLAIEILVVYLVGKWSWSDNTALGADSMWTSVVVLFLLGQLAAFWQVVSRAARYSVAVQVSQALVAPLSQPDPWASRIGGPGGPQYPIDKTDDYGVSI